MTSVTFWSQPTAVIRRYDFGKYKTHLLTYDQINKQVGLNNLVQVDDYTSMVAKSNLPAQRLRESNPKILEKPILTFADAKTMYYCGKVTLSYSVT